MAGRSGIANSGQKPACGQGPSVGDVIPTLQRGSRERFFKPCPQEMGAVCRLRRSWVMMSTTPTTKRCFCSDTPSWRRGCYPVLSALNELSLALTCPFALDIFTIIQQDHPEAFEELTSFDLELEELPELYRPQPTMRAEGCQPGRRASLARRS